jgi:hypothetical protein
MQKSFWYHNDVPQEMIDAFREAAIEIAESEEFQEAARPEVGNYNFVVGDDLEAGRDALLDVAGPGVERWFTFLREVEDVDL